MSNLVGLHRDSRGVLGVLEFAGLSFVPQRFFWITDTHPGTLRAGHAHRTCTQLLFPVSGSVKALVTPQHSSPRGTTLNPGDSLLIPPGNWLVLSEFSPHTILGVLASEPYNPSEYITDLAEFEDSFS